MFLQGWTKPLPDYIVNAINQGKITVNQARDHQYLLGETTYPNSNCIVAFK